MDLRTTYAGLLAKSVFTELARMKNELTLTTDPKANLGSSRVKAILMMVSEAIERGELQFALRLADSARRLVPEDVTILRLYAGLLLQLGCAGEAELRLRGRQETSLKILRGMALSTLGRTAETEDILDELLKKYAVGVIEELSLLWSSLSSGDVEDRPIGWIGVSTTCHLIGAVKTGGDVHVKLQNGLVLSVQCVCEHKGFVDFIAKMPEGYVGLVEAFVNGHSLIGSGFQWPLDFGFCGWVSKELDKLHGRVCLEWAPNLPVTLLIGEGDCPRMRHVVARTTDGIEGMLFSLSIRDRELLDKTLEVCVILPDGRRRHLLGSPTSEPQVPVSAGAIDRRKQGSEIVDIVIPVYTGTYETLRCIESVLSTVSKHRAELIVVDDASPDLELKNRLKQLASEGRITLFQNQNNLGFPGAANRGMHLHADRDVLLLNSDTEVFGDWLERLRAIAYAAPDRGTVTPLGESSSIVSYSRNLKYPWSSEEAATIDGIARELNENRTVELPVGVGFCMYIRRACLCEVGCFDEGSFLKGYGEENDFCLRARSKGWHHVAATNVFVRHLGAVSFDFRRFSLMERNHRVLNFLHPGYDQEVEAFVTSDPLLEYRRQIDMARLKRKIKRSVLLVSGNLTGGVERHITLRKAQLASSAQTAIVLRPYKDTGSEKWVQLLVQDSTFENLLFCVQRDLPVLRNLLVSLCLDSIEVHHFLGHSSALLDTIINLGIDYRIFVHDYSWICPRVALAGANGDYCQEPDLTVCELCVKMHGAIVTDPSTVAALRIRSAKILEGAEKVIAPAYDVQERLHRYFPWQPIKVEPWEKDLIRGERPKQERAGPLRVAIIGGIGRNKGIDVVEACARDAGMRSLPLEFVLIGFSSDDERLLTTQKVFITGPFEEDEVAILLEREKCALTFFASVVPETWCYALTHAICSGLPIVAFQLGAIGERLQDTRDSYLLPLSASPEEINDTLLEIGVESCSPFLNSAIKGNRYAF